jgi:hypothetical protein
MCKPSHTAPPQRTDQDAGGQRDDAPCALPLIAGCESLRGGAAFDAWIAHEASAGVAVAADQRTVRGVQVLQPDAAVCGGPSVILALKHAVATRARGTQVVVAHGFADALGTRSDAHLQAVQLVGPPSAPPGSLAAEPPASEMSAERVLGDPPFVEIPQHVRVVLDADGFLPVDLDSPGFGDVE